MRGALSFKQRDLTRALKATKAAGYVAARVEIEKGGKITIILTDGPSTLSVGAQDWEEALSNGR